MSNDAPGHTDLMVCPESLDEWLEKNPLPEEPPMNRFNRDFALVCHDGRILAESHSAERLEQLRAEMVAEGLTCAVVKSDLPREPRTAAGSLD